MTYDTGNLYYYFIHKRITKFVITSTDLKYFKYIQSVTSKSDVLIPQS